MADLSADLYGAPQAAIPTQALGTPQDAQTNPDDVLAKLPPNIGNQVKALAEGRMPFPSSFALKTPYWQNMLSAVSLYDPTFEAGDYNKRYQTAVAFSKGKQGDSVRAANQTLAHMGLLSDSVDKLNNFNGMATPLNSIVNPIEQAFGDPRQGLFEQQKQAVSSELRKVFSGTGGGGLAELEQWEKSLPVNASQEQQRAYLQSGTHLLGGALDALNNQYEAGMGHIANQKPLLSPTAKAVYDRLSNGQPSATTTAPTAAPMNLQALAQAEMARRKGNK